MAIPDSFGVNIHFTQADTRELEAIAGGGARFVRMDFSWGGTERRKGEYDFSAYDGLVADVGKVGIRCLFILDYSNRLYDEGLSPHSDEARAAFARWAGAASRHFAGKGVLWEIWNEPNISQFWKPKPNAEDYSKLALATIDAVRAADPQAFIMGPASSEFPWEFYDTMGKLGVFAKLDAVSVHPYRQRIPETAESDYARLRLLVEKYAPGKRLPIVSGEWGYSTAWGGMDEEKQANYIVRQRLMNLWMGVPLSIWYDWKDDGPDPKEPEHHFGTVYRDLKPKASYVAGTTLAETLAGYQFVRREMGAGNNDYLLIFRKGEDAAIVAWNSKQENAITLRNDWGPVTLVSREGQRKTVAAGSELRLGISPQYLLLDRSKSSSVAWWRPAESMTVLQGDGRATIQVIFEPPAGKPIKGRLEVTVDPDTVVIGRATVDVQAGEKKTVAIPIEYAKRDQRASLVQVSFVPQGVSEEQTALVWLLSTNPLGVSVLPTAGKNAAVLLENLSGQAVRGMVHLNGAGVTATSRIELASGQTQMLVNVALDKSLAAKQAIAVELANEAGKVMAAAPAVQWDPLPIAEGTWRVTLDGDAKVAGNADITVAAVKTPGPQIGIGQALEVGYQFGKGWRFASVMPAKKIGVMEGKPKMLGMWVLGDGSGNVLRCRFRDSSGQTFQPTYGAVNWMGWKWITMSLDGEAAGHWGGATDGVIHYPIQWDSVLVVDNAKGKVDQRLTLQMAGMAVGY
ncbi:MAG: cellulase family glycosylhydrolase [Bacillota bacterium]